MQMHKAIITMKIAIRAICQLKYELRNQARDLSSCSVWFFLRCSCLKSANSPTLYR